MNNEKTNPGSFGRKAHVVKLDQEREKKEREKEERERLIHTLTVIAKVLGIVAIALAYAAAIITRAEELPRKLEARQIASENEFRSGLHRLETKVDQGIQLSREENRDTQLDVRALATEIRTGKEIPRLSVPPPELKPVAEVKP